MSSPCARSRSRRSEVRARRDAGSLGRPDEPRNPGADGAIALGLAARHLATHNRAVLGCGRTATRSPTGPVKVGRAGVAGRRGRGVAGPAMVGLVWGGLVTSPARADTADGAARSDEPGLSAPPAPDRDAVEGLLLDVERIVSAETSSGWFVDRSALDAIHADVMQSACRVTGAVRKEALAALEREQASRGDPRALYAANGQELDGKVQDALETARKRAALQEADSRAEECPFWIEPEPGFDGLQNNRKRFVLSLETGGVAQLRHIDGSLTIGGGGVGRLLAGAGLDGPVTLLGGVEFGGGAMLEPRTDTSQPTQFVVNYFPAIPLLVRLHDVAWHYDFEVAPVALFQATDFSLSYGWRGGFAIGVSALRTRGLIPWAGAALAYDHYFESGGRRPADYLRGGLRIGVIYDP